MNYTWIDIANEEIASSVRNKLNGAGAQIPQLQSQITENKATINGISIGVRNLLLQSGVEVSNANYLVATYVPSSPLVAGKEYTVSIDITPSPTATHYGVYVSRAYSEMAILIPSGTERQILKKTFTAKYSAGRTPADNVRNGDVAIYRLPSTDTGTTTIHSIKIESGNRATDWTPAPEDVQSGIDAAQSSADGAQSTAESMLDRIYPVGAVYISVASTSPATLFGGTWTQIKDTFLLGAGDTYSAGATGGEAAHTLTTEEMPNHNHKSVSGYTNSALPDYFGGSTANFGIGNANTNSTTFLTSSTVGGGGAHNNMPPYLTVYMWQRTA
jgi:hypothetical protein